MASLMTLAIVRPALSVQRTDLNRGSSLMTISAWISVQSALPMMVEILGLTVAVDWHECLFCEATHAELELSGACLPAQHQHTAQH
jgi:hypothetical protein